MLAFVRRVDLIPDHQLIDLESTVHDRQGPRAISQTTRDLAGEARLRHHAALTALLQERADLRGVHALADHIDDAVRWSA